MNTLKAGKTSSLNEANDIDKNGKKFSIQFYKMIQSTSTVQSNLLEMV